MNPTLILTPYGRHLLWRAPRPRRTPVSFGCSTLLFGIGDSPETFCRARP
jgi:hypothetical protein